MLTGPHVANFSETFGPMIDRGAATEVATPTEIAGTVGDWLASPALLAEKRAAARAFARTEASALDQVIDRMIDCLAL